jgi:hypothetical protein
MLNIAWPPIGSAGIQQFDTDQVYGERVGQILLSLVGAPLTIYGNLSSNWRGLESVRLTVIPFVSLSWHYSELDAELEILWSIDPDATGELTPENMFLGVPAHHWLTDLNIQHQARQALDVFVTQAETAFSKISEAEARHFTTPNAPEWLQRPNFVFYVQRIQVKILYTRRINAEARLGPVYS